MLCGTSGNLALLGRSQQEFLPRKNVKVKHTWYKRKFLWNKVPEMANSGMSATMACDRIYQVYGENQSVTYILDKLKKDHIQRGGHPNLRDLNV